MQFIGVLKNITWFIIRSLLTTVVVMGLIVTYGYKTEPGWLEVKEQSVYIAGLPKSFEGYRIVQISDFHGKLFPDKEIVRRVNELKPDLIAITGDVFDDDKEVPLEYADNVLQGLAARQGVYFIFGNNEKYLGSRQVKEKLASININTLLDEKIELKLKGEKVELIGLSSDSTQFLKNSATGPQIVLAHKPYIINEAAEAGVDLVLAGHTHGGQIRIPGMRNLVVFVKRGYEQYVSGLHSVGSTQMYITRGLGEAKIPLRFFARPEISVITLHEK